MGHKLCFYFEGFKLTANHTNYLVEIHHTNEEVDSLDNIEDLPDWIYDARIAVWSNEHSASIYDRSMTRQIILQFFRASQSFASKR